MNQAHTQEAADLLWQHWQEGRRMPALPERCRPVTRVEGYAIQAALVRHSASTPFGWKIAATSAAGQQHIGVAGPLAGRILNERAYVSGTTLRFGGNHMKVAEAEFAFRMREDLAPRAVPYSREEVLAAVASLHPAIEVPDSRYDDFAQVGAAQLIADNACAHEFVLGTPAPVSWRELDLAAFGVLGTVRGKITREGRGENVLGDPRIALTWLVNELSGAGATLAAGQVVTTGTCLKPLEIEAGDAVLVDFGVLGKVEARFGA